MTTTSLPTPTYSLADWCSGYRSQPEEYSYPVTDLEGTIPAELQGTLFRNGPGQLEVYGQPVKHPFDGDGMVCSLRFHQGQAYFQNRYVRTREYLAEQAAQRPLYRGVFGSQKPGGPLANVLDLRLKNIANTHVIYWGGKLLALWEAAQPHRLDPATLDTLGLEDFDGLIPLGGSFTAHPKIDPGHHGDPRLVGFSAKPGLSTKITLYEFDLDGQRISQHSHSLPGFAFLHDFALTPNYAIFFQNPISFAPLPYLLGFKGAAECLHFDRHQSTRVILIPRHGQAPIQVIHTDPCFVFHHANAFEAEGQVVVDSVCYREFPQLPGGGDYTTVDFDQVPEGQLWRFHLDLNQGTARTETLLSRCVEFPSLHPDQLGRPHRYLYLGTAATAQGNAPLQALLRFDTQSRQSQLWSAGPRSFIGEPLFVPRPQGEGEDDGWVIAMVYAGDRQCSDVVILDGRDLAAGPLARLKLPHHIPYGLHGSFVPEIF